MSLSKTGLAILLLLRKTEISEAEIKKVAAKKMEMLGYYWTIKALEKGGLVTRKNEIYAISERGIKAIAEYEKHPPKLPRQVKLSDRVYVPPKSEPPRPESEQHKQYGSRGQRC